MSADEQWSQPELVRAIKSLTRAMEKFEASVEETLKDFDRKYVPREIYERDMAALRLRHERSDTWLRELLVPVFTALVSAVVTWSVVGHR